MSRDLEPRDPAGEAGDGVELVELHETRLPTRLDVPPTSVGARARTPRPDPRLAAVIAIAIVGIAILGTGPLAPQPSPSPSNGPSPSAVSAESSSPEATEPCTVAGPPTVSLGATNQFSGHFEASGSGERFQDIKVVAPVGRWLQVRAGDGLRVGISDPRCVRLVGVDIIDTSRPRSDPLTIRAPAPFEPGERSVLWDSPPAGDWIVRVALRLRESAGLGADGAWFVYFFRMNSGYVAWASPVPSGVDGGVAEGPLVTPAAPCASLSEDPAPPAVSLHVGDTTTTGIPGEYHWRGTTFTSDVEEELLAGGPIEIDGPVSLRIAGNACATNWFVSAGRIQDGAVFNAMVFLDESPENLSHSLEIAAQNTFAPVLGAFGTYVLRAAFDFENGDRETVYWLLHQPVGPVPEARATVDGATDPVGLVQGCGAELALPGGYGVEICEPGWPALLDSPTLELAANGVVLVDFEGDGPISGWLVQFASAAETESGGDVSCPFVMSSGYSGIGLTRLELPPFPPGQWIVRVALTFSTGPESSVMVPYFLRVTVEGEPLPLPTPSCGGDI